MNAEIFAKFYVIGINKLRLLCDGEGRKKKEGGKLGSDFFKLLKTDIEKMSAFRLSTMLMKTNELNASFHDVDDNKGSY